MHVAESTCIDGLLLDTPVGDAVWDMIENSTGDELVLALFNVSLEPRNDASDVNVHKIRPDATPGLLMTMGQEQWRDTDLSGDALEHVISKANIKEVEEEELRQLAKALIDSGVCLVASQRLIHPYLQEVLLQVRQASSVCLDSMLK